jgi:hypothetical protein
MAAAVDLIRVRELFAGLSVALSKVLAVADNSAAVERCSALVASIWSVVERASGVEGCCVARTLLEMLEDAMASVEAR